MENKFTILGSCVSRDIFNFDKEFITGEYYPRTTLQSLFGERYKINKDMIETKSEYHKKLIYNDLTCEFLSHKFVENEYLMIDFVDERFEIVKIKNRVIGTASYEYKISNLPKVLSGVNVRNEFEDWRSACDKLIRYLYEIKLEDKVILHEFFGTDLYINKNGDKVKFSEDRIAKTTIENEMFQQMYEYLKSKLPQIKTVGDKNKEFIGSEEHMWGLSPLHYEDSYYLNIAKQLRSI